MFNDDVTITAPRGVVEYFKWWLDRGHPPDEGVSSVMRAAVDEALSDSSRTEKT